MAQKRNRRAVVIGGLAVALAGWGLYQPEPPPAPVAHAAMPLLASNLAAADRIEIARQGQILRLERRGAVWCLASHGGYPVRMAMANGVIDTLLALRFVAPLGGTLASLGLESPADSAGSSVLVRVLARTGASLGAVVAGHDGPGDATIRTAGDPQGWRASGALEASADALDWIDPAILRIDPAQVAGAQAISGEGSAALDQAAAAARMTALQAAALLDVRPAAQVRAGALGSLVFTLGDGSIVRIDGAEAPDGVWLRFAADHDTPGVPPPIWAFRYAATTAALFRHGGED